LLESSRRPCTDAIEIAAPTPTGLILELPRFDGHLIMAVGARKGVRVGRNRRKFTPEFKAEAVALVEASGGNIAAVAKELGIYDSSLGNWVRQFREQAEGAPSVEERASAI
jgi:hypothetical protein